MNKQNSALARVPWRCGRRVRCCDYDSERWLAGRVVMTQKKTIDEAYLRLLFDTERGTRTVPSANNVIGVVAVNSVALYGPCAVCPPKRRGSERMASWWHMTPFGDGNKAASRRGAARRTGFGLNSEPPSARKHPPDRRLPQQWLACHLLELAR